MKNNTLIILILIIGLQSCVSKRKLIESPANYAYEQDKTWGLDISHYQEVYDWDKLKDQELGFIFVKATEGSDYQDPKYSEFYKEIRKRNIPVGSYHFLTYLSTGKNQANNFLSNAKYQRGDLPLVLDAEFAKKMPANEHVKKQLKEFVATIYKKTGFYPIIYCPYNYYVQYVKDNLPTKCKLWIVDYRGRPNCDWTFWQTTEKYRVHGIKGYVDFNQFNGTKKDLREMFL